MGAMVIKLMLLGLFRKSRAISLQQIFSYMKLVIQRVSEAAVKIDGQVKGAIGSGLLLLAGFAPDDTEEDLQWLSRKTVQLRIFADAADKMNRSLQDTGGDILLISQFTLHASTRKGNRPSYIGAAPPETAIPLYEKFIGILEADLGKPIQTGIFGADMKVSLVNDGPVTIQIDSKNRE
jgi:D-tyrosyl-tRNA(Tyr) deacylase